jgi:hypothetical protein
MSDLAIESLSGKVWRGQILIVLSKILIAFILVAVTVSVHAVGLAALLMRTLTSR